MQVNQGMRRDWHSWQRERNNTVVQETKSVMCSALVEPSKKAGALRLGEHYLSLLIVCIGQCYI